MRKQSPKAASGFLAEFVSTPGGGRGNHITALQSCTRRFRTSPFLKKRNAQPWKCYNTPTPKNTSLITPPPPKLDPCAITPPPSLIPLK